MVTNGQSRARMKLSDALANALAILESKYTSDVLRSGGRYEEGCNPVGKGGRQKKFLLLSEIRPLSKSFKL